jgi:hypothetical protein
MLQKLVSCLVYFWGCGIVLEVAATRDLAREVVVGVEVLEETSNSVEIFVNQVNATLLYHLNVIPRCTRRVSLR